MKTWKVAIYARVSTDKKGQQESIPAQVGSLKKWLQEKSNEDTNSIYQLVEIYEDQGFSGSNFERASFIRMKEDIEAGKINMVVTRDLSRFSRNYITAGYYIEDYFKVNSIRFISILDNVDTLEEVSDIVPFKNILNEMYIKDCSRRVKDALRQRMLRGSSIASRPPYGYRLETYYEGSLKTIKLLPANDDTTEIVKEIFRLFLNGWGYGRIATYLNTSNILPPSKRTGVYTNARFGIWNNGTIKSILTNPKYGGILMQQRWKKLSYKVKKVRQTDKKEWIFSGEFNGIIDKEIFMQVQEMINLRGQKYRYQGVTVHPYSGVLTCGDCGSSMCFNKKYEGYKCTNSQKGGNRCTAHSVKEQLLNNIIYKDIEKLVSSHINIDRILKELTGKRENETSKYNELDSVERELEKVDRQFEQLYDDRLNELISLRNFENTVKAIEKKQAFLIHRREELERKNLKQDFREDTAEVYKEMIDGLIHLTLFQRAAIEKLVDRIVVSEDKVTKVKTIDIYYKFKDSSTEETNIV